MLDDVILLRFMDPPNALKIRGKTSMTIVTHLEEYLLLRRWPLFRMLCTSTVSNCKVIWSTRTLHNQHTLHGQPSHHGNHRFVVLMSIVDQKVTACKTKPDSQSTMTIYNHSESLFPFHGTIGPQKRDHSSTNHCILTAFLAMSISSSQVHIS